MTARTPTTRSPSSETTSRSTPCVEGWFGPKLISRMSELGGTSLGTSSTVGIGEGIRVP